MSQDNMQAMCFFRIKTEYIAEAQHGELKRAKVEELVYASCYSDAEKIAYEIAERKNRSQFGSVSIEIIKEKRIADIMFNHLSVKYTDKMDGMVRNHFLISEDSQVGLYSVKVVFVTEEDGKEKRTYELFYLPAVSNSDATKQIDDHLEKSLQASMSYHVIRETKFDKAEAIYWPEDVYLAKIEKYKLQ